MSNIDWDFIGEKEGKRILSGYVPKTKNMKSGVTIATGFDLGQRNLSDLSGLPQDIIDALTPYLGIKGAAASDLATQLNISDSQAKIIDEFSHSEVLDDLRAKWQAATGESFDDLPMNKATIIASVRFQHGDLERKTPNFWREVTNDDWVSAVKNLRNFGDEFPTRRNSEADYYLSNIDPETQKKRLEDTLAVTAPADAPSRQLSNEELMAKVQGQIAESKEPVISDPDIQDFQVEVDPVEMEAVDFEGGIRTPIDTEIADFDIAQTNEQRALEQDFYDSPEAVDRTTKSNSMLPNTKAVTDSYTSLYGKSGEVYGNRVQSKFGNEDEYDYAVFDETFDNVWGAAFRQNNFVPAISRMLESMDSQYKPVEGYDAFKDKELKSQLGGDEGLWMFRHSASPAESQLKLERMKQDAEDMAFLSATDSTGAQVVASLASPTTLLPLAPARVMKMASGGKRFVGGTAFTGAALYPEQMLIESQNEYRDASHSALMLSALSLVGGSLAYKFGGVKRMVDSDMPTGSGGGFSGSQIPTDLNPMSPGPSTFTVFRGTGGESKISMPTTGMAMGDNVYYAQSKATASMYGKEVSEVNVTFDQPLILKTDDDLLSALSAFQIKTDFLDKYQTLLKAEKEFTAKVGKKGFLKANSKFADVFNDFNRSLNDSVQELESKLKDSGYDGVVVGYGRKEIDPSLGTDSGFTIKNFIKYHQNSFDNNKFLDNQFNHDQIIQFKNVKESDKSFRSAGASVSPERYRQSMYATMEQDALKETGIGLEKLPWNPVIRMLNSPNPFVRTVATGLVDAGGMMQKKVDEGLSMDQSVESTFRAKYLGPLRQALTEVDKTYLAYRGKVASDSDIARSVQMLRTSVSDKFNRAGSHMTEAQFRNRVARAMRRGDVDNVGDEASEFVTAAAGQYRKVFDLVKKEANNVRLFESQLTKDIAAARAANNVNRVKQLEEAMAKLQEQGVTANNALSYVPRIFRVDKIMERSSEFLSIVERHAVTSMRMSRSAAKTYAQNVMDTVTRSRPYLDLDDAADQLDFMISPSGVKASTLNVPDDLLEEFIENDIETLLRHHVKTMGMDIELTARYGSIDMKSTIDEITADYGRLIDETADTAKKAELSKRLTRDLEDLRGLRDRVRGTYGASKDPHQLSSRFVRVMKSFNVLVGMGGAMISSVPDVFRTTMVEGFRTTNEKGFKNLFADQAAYVKKLKQKELAAAGVAVDATLGLRAHSFSDMGDLFGSRYTLERGLNQATGVFFMMNGLNYWNQMLKEFAGNVTMLRMTDALTTTWEALSKADKEKLLKNGIDRQDAYRMRQQIQQHGTNVDGQKLPNTDDWTDPAMRLKFRIALNQNVERIIVTPGAGDRALWTSTEFGSMLTQFKSFGQGAMVRMATAGLQERDGAFWQGATLLVAMAGLVNEVKRAQYGMNDKETFDEKLLNAVDRSGVMGWAMDVNNAVEKLSDNKLGMRPAFTDQPQYKLPDTAKAGAVLGPSASNLMNISSVMGDVVTFNANQDTLDTARFVTPGSTLPYLDPIYDGVFGQ